QDVALSRRKQGFESPRERHDSKHLADPGVQLVSRLPPLTCRFFTVVRCSFFLLLSASMDALAWYRAPRNRLEPACEIPATRLLLRYGRRLSRSTALTECTRPLSIKKLVLLGATDAPQHTGSMRSPRVADHEGPDYARERARSRTPSVKVPRRFS